MAHEYMTLFFTRCNNNKYVLSSTSLMSLSLTSQGQVKIFHVFMKAEKKIHAPRE